MKKDPNLNYKSTILSMKTWIMILTKNKSKLYSKLKTFFCLETQDFSNVVMDVLLKYCVHFRSWKLIQKSDLKQRYPKRKKKQDQKYFQSHKQWMWNITDFSWLNEYLLTACSKNLSMHCKEVRFASFFSGEFITVIVVNPPERKLAKRISVALPEWWLPDGCQTMQCNS